jgi:hypothetical protein
MLDDIEIDISSYAVVKVDMVHENLKDLMLEVPPDDMMLAMWDAVTRGVQWRRTFIDVDPSAAASVLTTPSQPNTSPTSIFPKTFVSVSKSRTIVTISNSRAAMSVYNSRSVASVSTSDLEYPAPCT